MSEPIWCNIKVKVPTSWNAADHPPWFVSELSEALCDGSGRDIDEETPEFTIWGVDGEGNYGLADSWLEPLLDWLREHNVPFVAIEDAKYEWLGTYVWNDGFDERSSEYAGENIVLPESTYRGWLNGEPGAANDILAKLHRFFDVGNPPLSELSIGHLPAECPPKTEE